MTVARMVSARLVVLTAALLLSWAVNVRAASPQAPAQAGAAALLLQARALRETSPAGALPLAQAAVSAARNTGQAGVEVDALQLLGECHAAVGRSDRALESFREMLARSRAAGVPRRIAESHIRVSKTLMSLNQYEEAIEGYLEAIRLAEAVGDQELVAVATDHLGIAHFVLRNYDRAMALCRQAESVLAQTSNRPAHAENLQHIGIIYTGTEQWAEALSYFSRVVKLREELGERVALTGALSNVAIALSGLKRYGEALSHLNRALLVSGGESKSVEPLLRLRRGRVYQALGRTADAERDFELALEVDRTLGNKRRLASTLIAVAGLYRTIPGREGRALAALEEAIALNKSVYDEDKTARINELQERFDAERRQKQIELLERDKAINALEARRERQFRLAIVVVALLLVAGLVFAIVRYRAEARTTRELREALHNVRTLQGLLPICSHCKKIRNDEGYWQQVESYIGQHSGARFSHGICPDCVDHYYSDVKTR